MSTTQKEAMSSKGSEELQVKSKEVVVLQNQVKELEEKLQQADAILKQKVSFFSELYLLTMQFFKSTNIFSLSLLFSAESTITIRILPRALRC